MANLFDELVVKDIRLKNRIAVSPMCQYSAVDGHANAWHLVTHGARAAGGAGLVTVEANAVSPEGRITLGDLGLWNDAQVESLRPIVAFIAQQGAVPGVQIAHAGRKASSNRPWEGDNHMNAGDPGAWQPIAPSAIPYGANFPRTPKAMTLDDIRRVQADFVAAAKRALAAGFQWLEVHFAHGYLGQSFFSPLANQRTDAYGGSSENRARFLVETFQAVRAVWPERLPLTVRLGVIDYYPGEQPIEDSIALVRRLARDGLDLIDISMGFNTPDVSGVPWKEPGFLAPIAQRIKAETGILAATSWNIRDPVFADSLVHDGMVDLVMIGKAILADPHWPYHAAQTLGRPRPQDVLPVQFSQWLNRFK
jgi:2,4-dienoyl-CoA reductase-like NADH-dependent reductase (Old Yellow Enzyme family)